MTGRSKAETATHYAGLVEALKSYEPPTMEQVLDAFIDETRGDPDPGLVGSEIHLRCVPGTLVQVYLDTWSYYGPIWNARLVLPAQDFTVPLLEGPHVDAHQPPEDAIAEVVAWLRKITDAEADRDANDDD